MASSESEVELWDTRTLSRWFVGSTHNGSGGATSVTCAAFSRDPGNQFTIVAGTNDKVARVRASRTDRRAG